MGRKGLGEFETAVLLAIVRLQGRGYGARVADEIERRSGKPVSFGAVYATLDRLQKKGLISSELGDPTPERGGKPKRFYRIEAPGERALCDAREMSERMWAGVPRSRPQHEQGWITLGQRCEPPSFGRAYCTKSVPQLQTQQSLRACVFCARCAVNPRSCHLPIVAMPSIRALCQRTGAT